MIGNVLRYAYGVDEWRCTAVDSNCRPIQQAQECVSELIESSVCDAMSDGMQMGLEMYDVAINYICRDHVDGKRFKVPVKTLDGHRPVAAGLGLVRPSPSSLPSPLSPFPLLFPPFPSHPSPHLPSLPLEVGLLPFPSLPFLSLPFPPLPLEVGPLIQLGGLGERCKLPQWPTNDLVHLGQKEQLWWQQFYGFS